MTESKEKTLLSVRSIAIRSLAGWVRQALADTIATLSGDGSVARQRDARWLVKTQDQVLEQFQREISRCFNQLLGHDPAPAPQVEYGTLKLIDNEQLEAIIALEGMITHARNCDIADFLRLTTRLNDLFASQIVDESNNPLDPAQIGEAIKVSVEAINLSPEAQLTLYRNFNRCVFHQLESLLQEVNAFLKTEGILPGLDVQGRDKADIRTRRSNSRDKTDPNERAFSKPSALEPTAGSNQRDVFTLLQILMHNDAHKVATASLMHDSIEATDLLFKAIWDDVTVPEAIRMLIGRTSLTVLKASLSDKSLWDKPDHPIRQFLNELAEARSSTTLSDELEQDPLYLKARDLTLEFIAEDNADQKKALLLLTKLAEFKRQQIQPGRQPAAQTTSDPRVLCQKRLDEARNRADQKIRERVQNETLPPGILQLLQSHIRDFLVEIILAQGTGGDNWKPIMKTIDLLVWSVRPGKSPVDREKLASINDKLTSNISKALRVARLDTQKIESILKQLREAQDQSFNQAPGDAVTRPAETPVTGLQPQTLQTPAAPVRLPADPRFLQEAKNLPVGVWMDFVVDGAHTIHCTLAAKISNPDCYVFVNRQGVKVLEKPVTDVACELEAGTVRQISENVLFDRAIDTVIARLRARNENKSAARQDLHSAA